MTPATVEISAEDLTGDPPSSVFRCILTQRCISWLARSYDKMRPPASCGVISARSFPRCRPEYRAPSPECSCPRPVLLSQDFGLHPGPSIARPGS
jgi:hypothetical protein